jgi:hypothetical protein
MNAVPHDRGLALLAAHCASLDPLAQSARERLDDALGPALAHMLVFALSAGTGTGTGARSASGAGTVFAA